MRWQELFADLESQARSLERADQDGEIAERTRAEIGQITLVNRLRSQIGEPVRLTVSGQQTVGGRLDQVGADWLLLAGPTEVIVPMSGVTSVTDLPLAAVSPEGVGDVASRITLASALRAVAIDRAAVRVRFRDKSTLTGTPDRVGADFFDLAVHDLGDVPRTSSVRTRETIGYAAVAFVQRANTGWG